MSGNETADTLLARVAMADRTAFETLYSDHAAPFFGIALRILKNQFEAEQILQDVFARIWNEADALRGQKTPADAELVQTLRRDAIALKRTRATTPVEVATKELFGASRSSASQDGAPSLEAILADLPPAQSLLVTRALTEGESYAELSAATDVEEATLRASMHKTLLKISKRLDESDASSEADAIEAAELSLGLRASDRAGQTSPLQAIWDRNVAAMAVSQTDPVPPPPQLFRRITAQVFRDERETLWRQLWPYAVGGAIAALVLWMAVNSNLLLPLE